MSVGSPTAGTWSSSQWRPDNEFETDTVVGGLLHRLFRAAFWAPEPPAPKGWPFLGLRHRKGKVRTPFDVASARYVTCLARHHDQPTDGGWGVTTRSTRPEASNPPTLQGGRHVGV